MPDNSRVNKTKESISFKSGKEKFHKLEDSKEVQKAAVGKEAKEAVSYEESIETTGRVSEVVKDQSEQGGGAATGSAQSATVDPEAIKAKLLKKIPSERVMRRQIESEIKNEIKYLHKKAVKLMAVPSGMSYFEMTNLMRKIRELKGILVKLVKASVESLKTLWLRFVHGVM